MNKLKISSDMGMRERLGFVRETKSGLIKKTDLELLTQIEFCERFSDYRIYLDEFVERNRNYFRRCIDDAKMSFSDNSFPDLFLHKIGVAYSEFVQVGSRSMYAEERRIVRYSVEIMPDYMNDDHAIYNLNFLMTFKIIEYAKEIAKKEKNALERLLYPNH